MSQSNVDSKSLSSPGPSTQSMTLTTWEEDSTGSREKESLQGFPETHGRRQRAPVSQQRGTERSANRRLKEEANSSSSSSISSHSSDLDEKTLSSSSTTSVPMNHYSNTRFAGKTTPFKHSSRTKRAGSRTRDYVGNTGQRNEDTELDKQSARKAAYRRWPWLFGDEDPVNSSRRNKLEPHPKTEESCKQSPYIQALKRLALQRSSMGIAGDVERSLAAETRLDFARNVICRYTEMSLMYEHYYLEQANAIAEVIDSSIGTALTGDMPRNSLDRRKEIARRAGLHPIAATSRNEDTNQEIVSVRGGPRLPSFASLPPDVQASMRESVEALAEKQARNDMRPSALSALEMALNEERERERYSKEQEELKRQADEARNYVESMRGPKERRRRRTKQKKSSSNNKDERQWQSQNHARREKEHSNNSRYSKHTSQRASGKHAIPGGREGGQSSSISIQNSPDTRLTDSTSLQPNEVSEFEEFRKRVQQRLNESLGSYEAFKRSWKEFNDDSDNSSLSSNSFDTQDKEEQSHSDPLDQENTDNEHHPTEGHRRRRRSSVESFDNLASSARFIRDGLQNVQNRVST